MVDLLMASVIVLLFTIIFLLGVGLGWWVRNQLAMAWVVKESPNKDLHIPSEAEMEARANQSQAEINSKLKKMGLPYAEV